MFDFHEKRRIRRWLYSWYAVGCIFLLATLISFGTWKRFTVERQMFEKREAAEAELRAQKERRALMEGKVNHLKEDRGIEEEIRNRFDVAKEGEQVVILVGDAPKQESTTESIMDVREGKSESFWSIFKFW